jgi:DNA-binding transcriptional ArsR family regulator
MFRGEEGELAFPIQTSRRDGRVRQPVERGVVEDDVWREALGLARLGLEQANVSQHLAVLRAKQVVVGRKKGTQVYYSLRDPVLGKILNLMRRYFRTHIHEILELYQTMDEKG